MPANLPDGCPDPVAFAALPALVGPVTLTSGQSLVGRRITRNGGGPAVTINGTGCSVVGCEIVNSPTGAISDYGIQILEGSKDTIIESNWIHSVSCAVYGYRATNTVMQYNLVTSVRGPFPRGQMAQFEECNVGEVHANVSDGFYPGIAVSYEDHINLHKTSDFRLTQNRLRGGTSASGSGMMMGDYGGDRNLSANNVVILTPNVGIGCVGGQDNVISDNRVNCRGANAASKTSGSIIVMTQAGYPVGTGTCVVRGNRGTARGWLYGGTGGDSPGFYTPKSPADGNYATNRFGSVTDIDNLTDTTVALDEFLTPVGQWPKSLADAQLTAPAPAPTPPPPPAPPAQAVVFWEGQPLAIDGQDIGIT